MNSLYFDLLIVGIAVAASLMLGFVVFFRNPRSITNGLFLFFTIINSAWGVLNYINYNYINPSNTLIIIRLIMFFAVLQAFSFFSLMYVFPDDSKKFPNWWYAFVFTVILTAVLSLTPWVFSGIRFLPGERGGSPIPAPGIILFALSAVGSVFGGIIALCRKYSRALAEDKAKFKYLLIGVVTMFALIIVFNFLFPVVFNNITFIPYAAVFTFPFVLFTFYAISRHGLLDVKVLSTEVLSFLITAVALFEIIFSENLVQILFRIAVFILMLIFSILLIKSVLQEVRQREQLQQLSKQLEAANKQLKQIDQAKTEFLSITSHQLRTPLTAIKGYLSMFLDGDFGPLNDPQKNQLKVVFDSSERLLQLVTDLLDLSRIESGKMEFDFGPVNICSVVESVIEELSQKAKNKNLYLYFDNINHYCPDIRADLEKITEVVTNLIDNAIKYTNDGGVTIRLLRHNDDIQLYVEDTGIGIALEDQAKIFEKFFRTTAANEVTREGSGLGVYVVKKIVEAHGGKVWFESAGTGKGTKFVISFPVPPVPIKKERVSIASLEAF